MNPAQLEQLLQRLAPGGTLRQTRPLAGGLSADMTVLEAQMPTGQTRRWIMRQYRHGDRGHKLHKAETEFKVLQITRALGLPTPAPYFLDLSGTYFVPPTLVIDYIEGEMVFSPSNLESHLQQMAAHLAQIHSADGSRFDFSFLPQIDNGCPELQRPRPLPPETSLHPDIVLQTLASHQPLPPQNTPRLLHGDYWPGNTLWQDGRLTAVIDWEDAKVGDPLIDLANSRLEIGWIFGIDALNSFTRHYRTLIALDDTNLPYWELCAALRLARMVGSDLAEWAAYFHPFGRQDVTTSSLRQNYDLFTAQALAALRS